MTGAPRRERIVVALTGGPEGEALLRRAELIAARHCGSGPAADLLAVHVAGAAPVRHTRAADLEPLRVQVEAAGGSYHSLVSSDVATAVLDFAHRVEATQLVIGASGRRAWAALFAGPGVGQTLTQRAGELDVHVVAHRFAGQRLPLPRLGYGIAPRRTVLGLVTAGVLLVALTLVLARLREHVSFPADLSIYLLLVVLTSLIGGFWPALLAAVAGSLLLNYYFAPPLHTLTIARTDNAIAVGVFLLVAVLVSRVVDAAARRTAEARRASAEAETLAALAGSVLRGEEHLQALLTRVQETFGMRSVALLRGPVTGPGAGAPWEVLSAVGKVPAVDPGGAEVVVELGEGRVLALVGRGLDAEDRRILSAFAAQVAVAYRELELAKAARAARSLAESERARTALLNAVSHDLRTPIASAKTAVSSLLADDVDWSASDRRELLLAADESLDRLTELVTNLLDLSRLQAGVLPVLVRPVGLDDVVRRALEHAVPPAPWLDAAPAQPAGTPPARVQLDVPPDLPEVLADAGLLERVVANLVQNALRYAPDGTSVLIQARAGEAPGTVQLRVVDHGPGIPAAQAEHIFAAFQRRDDVPSNGAGVGLGLAIARGFTDAMGGSVTTTRTPGGGATFVVRLRTAGGVLPESEPVHIRATADHTDPAPAAASERT